MHLDIINHDRVLMWMRYLFDRIKILLSINTAVNSIMKLSTSKHCNNGWNDICITKGWSIYNMFNHNIDKSRKSGRLALTSAWGNPSIGGTSTERRLFSIANRSLSFPGVGSGTFETVCAITSHNGLLKLI